MTGAMHEHGDGGHRHDARPAVALRQRGRRLTRQREAIWEVLTASPDTHLGADEIADRVRALQPGVNASTVYRSLEVLVEEGFVRRSDFGTGRTLFEPAHEHLHHHLVCESCGCVMHVHDHELGDLGERLERRFGFRLTRRETTLFGLCQACSSAGASRKE
jgi:Fur family ferric uptake transcriptional regulator